MRNVRLAAVVASVLAVLAFASAAGAATLNGQKLYKSELFTSPPPITGQCTTNQDGTTTYSFDVVDGIAVGPPYFGTFTEHATVTIAPQTGGAVPFPPFGPFIPGNPVPGSPDPASFFTSGTLLSFDATFRIDAADGTVVQGEKHLTTAGPADVGTCSEYTNKQFPMGSTSGFYRDARANGTLIYTATIQPPSGPSSTDSGSSTVWVRDGCAGPSCVFGEFRDFLEFFTSSRTADPTPATLTLSPAAATNPVGTDHTITATVTDAAGQPVAGVRVLARVQGSVNTILSCTTGADGTCQLTYTGPDLPGADQIAAVADSNGNGRPDAGEPVAFATKAWVLPDSTPGHATGGGQVPKPDGGDHVAFGFDVRSDGAPAGHCNVVDPAAGVHIKCLTVTAVVQSGNHVTFFGRADVDGTEAEYRIDADDNGEPGRDRDTFKIHTSNGYTAGGTLDRGNVQVH